MFIFVCRHLWDFMGFSIFELLRVKKAKQFMHQSFG